MLTKIISLHLISCLCLQSLTIPFKQSVYDENDQYIYIESFDKSEYKLIASIPDKNIKLFASTCQYPDLYDNFLLNIDGKEKIFRWENVTSPIYNPKLILSDINNDKKEELIIILTTGTGTATHISNVHILDISNFNEYLIADPFIIINENVSSKIIEKENHLFIQLNLCNEKYNIKKDKNNKFFFNDVGFGNKIYWDIVDNKLYCYIYTQISPSEYIGKIIIQYKFKNNVFNLDNLYFEEFT